MQKFLAPFPLVRLLIPLVIGIAIAYRFQLSTAVFITIGLLSLVGVLLESFYLKKSSRFYTLNGLSIFIFFFCCGILLNNFRLNAQLESESDIIARSPAIIRVLGDPEIKDNNIRCKGDIIAVLEDSAWKETSAGVMLYLKRNPRSEQIRYGDEILANAGVIQPSQPMNPGEFNFAEWLHRKGIGFVCFAKDEWELKGHSEVSWIKARALELRTYFRDRMVACGLSGQELAVSEGLLLGQSSEIDPQLLSSYSASGTLHVLSVSGMHVALVFVVLLKILAPLEKRRKGQWISFVIQFFVIWFYAFMTGMSPSVLRSVTMLSVIITGRMIRRKAHLLNTLAASAIILLIGDPMLLMDAGFLLSYCAVAGIVIVQPVIENWWTPRSTLMKPLWSLTSVTIAAQVFTFPLGLYFFNQFPTWFVISNLVVIPLSTICLYAGLFFLAISWWTWAASLFAIAFGWMISLLNSTVSLAEFMPASVIETSTWSGLQLGLLYAVIIFILLVFHLKIKRAVIGSMACILILVMSMVLDNSAAMNLHELTIFHINRGLVVGLSGNGEATLISDSITVADPEKFSFHVEPHYRHHGILDMQVYDRSEFDSLALSYGKYLNGCIFTPEYNFWIGDRNSMPPVSMLCDALIIHGKNFWLINELSDVKTHEIILTGEVRKKWIDKWKEEGNRRGVPVYVTSESGARVFKF